MPDQPAREVDHRKPPLESRWTRNRRLLEGPGGEPPGPPYDYELTGALTPDATGDYYEDGVHLGFPKYRREDSAYWIWRFPPANVWIISIFPESPGGSWRRYQPDVLGAYDPWAPFLGVATVELP